MGFPWIFFIGFLIEHTYACSEIQDANNHPQSLYCRAKFAAKVRVKLEITEGEDEWVMNNKYTVVVLKIFKDSSGLLKEHKKAFFVSSASPGMCGSTLTVGKIYFVSGQYYNKQYDFNAFDWVEQWAYMSKPQKNYLKYGQYEANCECQIAKCLDGMCEENDMQADCQWAPGDYKDCWAKNGACVKSKKNGKCEWNRKSKQCGKMIFMSPFSSPTTPLPIK